MVAASPAAGPGGHLSIHDLSAGRDIVFGYTMPPGLDPLPLQLRTNIGNFLHRYLGTREKPVPFGGRETELAFLEAWRAAPGKRLLLLAAPSGRGKSALLTHWTARLSDGPPIGEVAVVFVPISIRYRTNLPDLIFPCIAVQLAGLLGEEIPTTSLHMNAGQWQSLVGEYLRRPLPDGRQLLLIIDGLDEAAWDIGPDLLPHNLPDSTRVAVSARYLGGETPTPKHWLGRLGWDGLATAEALTLAPLTAEGVSEVLVHMGNPLDVLAEKDWVIEQLYRLTKGDPLLVELYVQDLTRRGKAVAHLRPEDLASMKPGYGGYFAKWWADQEKLWARQGRDPREQEAALALLFLLAMSKGPLNASDLIQLAPELLGTKIAVDRAARLWQRWIQGDGRVVGFAFAHPKLSDYIREEHMAAHEHEQWQAAFVRWGQATVAALTSGTPVQEPVSPYLLQYYAGHLRDAAAPPEVYLPLLTPAWAESWHRLAGSYSGFLSDVALVLDQLLAADRQAIERGDLAPYTGQEILCLLLHTSVNSLSNNMPLELLLALHHYGGWTDDQVLAYARQIPDAEKRSAALRALTPGLNPERQKGALVEARAAARVVEAEGARARVLSALAPHLPEAERAEVLAEALAAARAIADEKSQTEVLSELLSHLPEAEREETLATALTIRDEESRAKVLSRLAPHLPAEVLAAAQAIGNEGRRARVLSELAPHLPAEVLAAARVVEAEGTRARVLSALAPYLPEAERVEVLAEALALARNIGGKVSPQRGQPRLALQSPDEERAEVLSALALQLPEAERAGVLADALVAARAIRHKGLRARVLSALIPPLPEAERAEVLAEALAVAKQIDGFTTRYDPDDRDRVKVITLLAPYLSDEILALAPSLPAEVLAAAQAIGDEGLKIEVLSALAPHLPEAERAEVLAEALVAARTIRDEESRAKVLRALAPSLPAEVLAAAQAIGDEALKIEVLSAVAPHLPEAERVEVLAEALVAARTIRDEKSRAKVLVALASHLPVEVLAAARSIRDEESRAYVLRALAPHLPVEVLAAARSIRDDVYRAYVLSAVASQLPFEVLAAARSIRDEESRAYVLSAVAPHLPEAERAWVLGEALSAAQAIGNEESRAGVLVALARHLPAEVLAAAQAIENGWSQAMVLGALAPHLPEAERAWVLSGLAPRLPEGARARVLGALAPHLPEAERAGVLSEALSAAQAVGDDWHRAGVLVALAPLLPAEVLAAARVVEAEGARARVLGALAPHLPEAERAGSRPYLAPQTHGKLMADWQSLVPDLQQMQRGSVLEVITGWLPVIEHLGGLAALQQTVRAVALVPSWLP